jgi:tRNA(His) guanylyltransferase
MSKDNLGDRMKEIERAGSGQRLMPLLPVICRLDGKGFSKFTRGLQRPYDERMSRLMTKVTELLVSETNALIGYTQSDEISLVLYSDSHKSKIHFDGRIQKLVGDLAAFTSVMFNHLLPEYIPEKANKFPRFDCRIWNVPTKMEAANTILWRELDASKNSISMAASHYYSHNELSHKSGKIKKDMMIEKGVNWNDYPDFFKRGVFIRREKTFRSFTEEELSKLSDKHHARQNPDMKYDRQEVKILPMPPFSKVTNRVGVIFDREPPQTEQEE